MLIHLKNRFVRLISLKTFENSVITLVINDYINECACEQFV